jgi:hypothetical protein
LLGMWHVVHYESLYVHATQLVSLTFLLMFQSWLL